MLTANRFTVVPTKVTQNRLNEAFNNHRPIARGERNRATVMVIQSAISDLNRGYLLDSEIDGYFGARTYSAVVGFQRDYGLPADGIVGRQTLMQLDELFSDPLIRQPKGLSVHIGVDKVNPNHYGGEYKLSSCANDAHKMHEIAEDIGYDAVTFVNEEATVRNFMTFMRSAISELVDGDSLMFTFSGHGSQIPNIRFDSESDMLDETFCFYDRMFLDDELYVLTSQFREGVRVHMLFDSCHSGTAAKAINSAFLRDEPALYHQKTLGTLKKLQQGNKTARKGGVPENSLVLPISSSSITKALDGDKPKFVAPVMAEDRDEDIAALFTEIYAESILGEDKSIELFDPIYDSNQELYDAIIDAIGDGGNYELACSVVTLSACEDSQTTPAGRVFSLFTYNIMTAWASGDFGGSYSQFHRHLIKESRFDAMPVINTYGTGRANVRLWDRPFVI